MSGPLEGVRVIECAHWVFGPAVGAMLGELGADVIKVEPREGGDAARGLMSVSQNWATSAITRNFSTEYTNRNKRSIALELRQETGRQIIYKLIQHADVFIHNFRLDALPRLGLDYETVSHYNPNIIYAQCSGWGPGGPDHLKPTFETIAWARTGWLYLAGTPDMPPLWFVSGHGDEIGATKMALAIVAALLAKEKQGIGGQHVDTSLLGSLISMAGLAFNTKLVLGEEFPRRDRNKVVNALANLYQCDDGRWIFLYMLQSDRYWHDFCKVMGIEDLENDPRFNSSDARSQNSAELIATVDKQFATKSQAEWLDRLGSEGDLAYGAVQTISEAITDPQIIANDYIADFEHPSLGPIKVVGVPYKFSKTPAAMKSIEPQLGEHTEEILLEAGYTWDDITELKDQEVIL